MSERGSTRRLALALALALSSVLGLGLGLGCKDERSAEDAPAARPSASLDGGALRASAVEGLEAAARSPETAVRLGLAATLESERVEAEAAALVDRLGADATLAAETERLFDSLQDSEVMRAALLDYARAHPELDVAGLSAGFSAHVGDRLTRPELADALRSTLRGHGRGLDPALARAVMIDGGGARALGEEVAAAVETLARSGALDDALGRDLAEVQARLERRLGDRDRAAILLTAFGLWLADGPATALVCELLTREASVTALAAGLTRALADEPLRARVEALFGLALADSFAPERFRRALTELLAEPVIEREARAWLGALAREPATREALADLVERFAATAEFEAAVTESVS